MTDMQQDPIESQDASVNSQEPVLTPGQNYQLLLMNTEKQFRGGVSWFYWIAGLSLVTSVLWLMGKGMTFLAGLGATQLIDGVVIEIAEQAGDSLKYAAFGVDILIAGVYVLIGYLGLKRFKAAIIVGMVLYGLDALIFLLVGDFLSIGFHAFALFCIFGGLKALNRLEALEAGMPQSAET